MDSVAERAAPEQQTAYTYEYVMRLPEKYRIAVQLFYYEQLSTDQIAGYMKTKPATVRSYLHRSREKLREMMEADGYVG
jgi:RNA polymerase sigma-70 factor (ECF subfamily)